MGGEINKWGSMPLVMNWEAMSSYMSFYKPGFSFQLRVSVTSGPLKGIFLRIYPPAHSPKKAT